VRAPTLLCLPCPLPQMDGQLLPGKKGISLPPDQFAKLAAGAPALGEALRGRDTSFEVDLSNK
jgi:hypothetical protein